jgi:hypothetical protein
MTDPSLATEIAQLLGRDDYLGAGRNRLIRYREAGGDAESARAVLESLRSEVDEDGQDKVLELLDLASGFCAQELRIWKDTVEVSDGSTWRLKDPQGDLRGLVRILGHETHEQAGPVVHVRISGLTSASGPLPITEVGHLPVTPQVFFESIRAGAGESDDAPAGEGIDHWRAAADRGEGGVFGIVLADAVRFAVQTVANSADPQSA